MAKYCKSNIDAEGEGRREREEDDERIRHRKVLKSCDFKLLEGERSLTRKEESVLRRASFAIWKFPEANCLDSCYSCDRLCVHSVCLCIRLHA